MLNFDDNAHKFQVVPQSPQLTLEFGNRTFFTSLTTGLPATQIEASLAAGQLFNNFLVFPALSFFAKAVALVPTGGDPTAAEIRFRNNFEFGFVQGIRNSGINLEYWASTRADGRTTVHITMPQVFEVDTEASIQPWTSARSERFQVRNAPSTSKFLSFEVKADFSDHPMLGFPHTLSIAPHPTRFLRWIRFTLDFRTIFCFRDKADGSFTPISATFWSVIFNHLVSYTENGSKRSINNRSGPPNFPRGGSPSDVNDADRKILAMAKRGSPFMTPPVLAARINDPARRTEDDETPNQDFDPAFWK